MTQDNGMVVPRCYLHGGAMVTYEEKKREKWPTPSKFMQTKSTSPSDDTLHVRF